MKISDKKQTELYKAFSEPIIQLRILIERTEPDNEIDAKLFKLEQDIWRNIAKVLDLKKP